MTEIKAILPPLLPDHASAIAAAKELAADWRAKAAKRDSERILPFAEIEAFTASGLGAITVPKAYGGSGLSLRTLVEVFEILCAADGSLGQIPQNHFAVIQLLIEAGSESQKSRIFKDILSGERIGNAGPEKGPAPITSNKTGLSETPEGLRLNGRRFYSTGSLFAHWIPTRASDSQGRPLQVWLRHDAAGVSVLDDWNAFGQRTTASGTVIFENVAVDPEQIIPLWQRADIPGLTGPFSQVLQAAIDSGIAIQAFEDTLDFVRNRSRPWVDSAVRRAQDDPYIIAEIGHLQIGLWAAQELLREAADLIDELARTPVTAQSSAQASVSVAKAKIATSEIALKTSEKLFELAGSASVRAEHNLGRHWRNARTHTLHDPLRWKYHLLGNWQLNNVLPARHQWN